MGSICISPKEQESNNIPNKRNQMNQVSPIFQTKNNQINQNQNQNNNNNIGINKEKDLNKNNNTNPNSNIKKPELHVYDQNLLVSTASMQSNASSDQKEILITGGKLNPDYLYQSGDLSNSNYINLVKYKNGNEKPLTESFNSISYSQGNNRNKINISDENKAGTFVSNRRPNLPIMQSQKLKQNQFNFNNNNNKINVSLHGSGAGPGAYIYYPNKDNVPILDFENISEEMEEKN